MLVSIIVPFYNVEAYFRRCLESIINQSYQHLEIILINDCSPDNSIAIAREYAAKDRRIVIIEHEQSLHVGGARNTGLAAARGDYVWFVDADDEIASPYALEYLMAQSQQGTADVITMHTVFVHKHQAYYYYDEHGLRTYDYQGYQEIYKNQVLRVKEYAQSVDLSPCNKLFRRSFLQRYNFQFLEHTIHEDYILALYLSLAGVVSLTPLALYNYIKRDNSTTSGLPPQDYPEHLWRVGKQMQAFYNQYLKEEQHRDFFEALVISLYEHARLKEWILTHNKGTREASLARLYNDIHRLIGASSTLLNLEPFPSHIMGSPIDSRLWIRLLSSFKEAALSERQKALVIEQMLAIAPRKWSNSIKLIVKMLLPHGIIGLAQQWQKQKNKDKQSEI